MTQWIAVASKDIGNPESLGPNDSPLIRKVLAKVNGLWLKGQPWCGSFIAYVMQQCGIPYPKDYYRAKAWASWGITCGPVFGAVVVFERTGGGHVGILTGQDSKGLLRVLGGNQNDMVRESWFKPDRVVAYRWPPGRSFVATALPVVPTGELSRSEA
jgi:uncharacterized protein (TIGR02594 family)